MSGSPQLPVIVPNERDFGTKDNEIRIFCVCLCQCDLRAIGPEGGVSKLWTVATVLKESENLQCAYEQNEEECVATGFILGHCSP